MSQPTTSRLDRVAMDLAVSVLLDSFAKPRVTDVSDPAFTRIKLAQEILGMTPDGWLGPNTYGELKRYVSPDVTIHIHPTQVYARLCR